MEYTEEQLREAIISYIEEGDNLLMLLKLSAIRAIGSLPKEQLAAIVTTLDIPIQS